MRCENAKKLDYIISQNGVSLQIALNFLVLNYQRKFSGAVQFECREKKMERSANMVEKMEEKGKKRGKIESQIGTHSASNFLDEEVA